MKYKKRVQKLQARIQDYEEMLKNPNAPEKVKQGLRRPGSYKK